MSLSTTTSNVAALIVRSANFAAVKHRHQKRLDSDQTPYINHPIGVAAILVDEGRIFDGDVLAAALLHDTVEDTPTTFDEIETCFGLKVCSIVREVTDDKSLPKARRKELQIEHAATSSYEAKLVKLADKLYNLRDLLRCRPNGWTEDRVNEYFHWAHRVVAGLRGTNKCLEDALDEVFAQTGLDFEE